jgi:hypothetical protein
MFALPVPVKRDRDPHNYMPAVKAAIDGIVDTQLVVPNDTAPWVTVREPWLGLIEGQEVRVRLRCSAPLQVEIPF